MKVHLMLFLMAITSVGFGQKQKDKDKAFQAQIDTLTKANGTLTASNTSLTEANKTLSLQKDSVAKAMEQYYGLYKVIKEKVVKMDFDPARMSHIIDSLRAGRDSLVSLSGASSVLLRDSLKRLHVVNDSLVKEIQGLKYAVNLLRGGQATSPGDPKDFAGIWNIILRKVMVSGQSPHSGIIDISAEPVAKTASLMETYSLSSVNFVDKEVAELTFSNGEKAKCFYELKEFSKIKPYYVDFKGTKADFRMYFMNTAQGARISFEIPGSTGQYYFGMMTK